MTAEIMSPRILAFSLAEQAFQDAENLEEQNLIEEFLDICSAAEVACRRYLRTHPTDLTAACRFFAAQTEWNCDTWMQAGHDERIRMIEDLTDIMKHIAFYQPHTAGIPAILQECRNLIEQLRWIRISLQFDRGDESTWDKEVYLW